MATQQRAPVTRRRRRTDEGGGKNIRIINVDNAVYNDPQGIVEDGLLRSTRLGASIPAPTQPTQVYQWRQAHAPPIYRGNSYTLWREPRNALNSSKLINWISEMCYTSELSEDNIEHRRAKRKEALLENAYYLITAGTGFVGLILLPVIFGWSWGSGGP